MTLRNPGKFPKNLGGFDGLGRQAAGEIDRLDAPFLRKRTATAQAIKKGEFLYVKRIEELTGDPVVWALVQRLTDDLNNPRGYRSAGAKFAFAQLGERQTVDSQAVNDFGQQVYVGDGYILRMNTSFVPITDGDEFPDVDAWDGLCWPSLQKPDSTAPEVLSLSLDNVAGANVSFKDVCLLPCHRPTDDTSTQPSLVAMGWDESVQGYAFGIFKHTGAYATEGAPENTYDLEIWLGNTATRTLEKVTLPRPAANANWRWNNARCWTVGPGRLLALGVPFDTLGGPTIAYPEAPSFLRSSDFGRTWTESAATELVPHLLRVTDSDGVTTHYNYTGLQVCLPWCFLASPIGGGRVAIVVLCSDRNEPVPNEESTGGTFAAKVTRWKFFVSDEDGENFVNKPWPADGWYGFKANRDLEWPVPETFAPEKPHLSAERQAVQGTQLSAGPGSFFLSAADLTAAGVQRVRVLSTTDYGETWKLSEPVPADGVNPQNAYCAITFAVARAGRVYFAASRDGGPYCVFRTNKAFPGFRKVTNVDDSELRADTADVTYFDAYLGTAYAPPSINPVRLLHIGAPGTQFPPRVHAGYPGVYDKP